MPAPIINAKDKPLLDNSANYPDVSAVVMGLLYPMVFQVIQTTIVNGYAQKIAVKTSTLACIQPFSAQMLKIKPEGQRNWSWFLIYSLTDLVLQNNDKIVVDGVQYKIMEKIDWSKNQYLEYHAILDYQNNVSG